MKLLTIGDSITRGSYTGPNDPCPLSVANPNFSLMLKEMLGFSELKCCGINGVSISATSYQNPEFAICKNYDNLEDGDFLIVAGGTNDYGTDVVLGKIEDKEDISFYGAVELLFSKISKKMPKEKVVVIIPINREYEDKNKAGFTLKAYRLALEIKAKEYGFFIVDGRKMGFNPNDPENKKKYISDGLHPTQEGHKLYADYVYSCIKDLI
jgi:lysophospholipase L1-like esterase